MLSAEDFGNSNMNKVKCCLAMVGCVLVAAAHAGSNKKFLKLEDAALSQAKKWQETGVAKPIMSDDGKILFPFGQYMPQLTCAPLRTCDIELEPGEIVKGAPLTGDKVRWKITRAESGSGDSKVTHVVVKPIDTSLDTNLIINTDRRTYHVKLHSSENERDYMNRIGFYYPENIVDEWEKAAQQAEKEQSEKERFIVSELPSLSVDKLDFSYKVEGTDESRFKPARVFNDGTHVFIQMPESMSSDEAPVLLLLDKEDKPLLVNYRIKGTYYIVDKLFDQAMLVVGTERSQSKVIITWTKYQKKEKRWIW